MLGAVVKRCQNLKELAVRNHFIKIVLRCFCVNVYRALRTDLMNVFFHLIEANTSRISGELQIHDHSLIRLRFGNLVENIETHFYYPVYEHLFAIKGTSKKLPIGNTHMGCYVFLCSPS